MADTLMDKACEVCEHPVARHRQTRRENVLYCNECNKECALGNDDDEAGLMVDFNMQSIGI